MGTILDIWSTLNIVIILFVIIFGFYKTFRRKGNGDCQNYIRYMPGPRAIPILGTYWMFFLKKYNFSKLHEYYNDLHIKYGGIVKEEAFLNIPVINVFSKSDIETVLRSGGKYPIRPPTEAIAHHRRSRPDRYASTGLVNEQGEKWHDLRVCLTKDLMSPKTISDFLPQIQEMASDFCELIRTNRDSSDIIYDIGDLFSRLGLETSCTLNLGRRMAFLLPGKESDIARELADVIHDNFIAMRDTYFGIPFWTIFNTTAYQKLTESENRIYDLTLKLIQEANSDAQNSPIFHSIMKAQIDEKEKIAAIVDFIAAGIHTLKNSLIFLLYMVAAHPTAQQKILADESKTFIRACTLEAFRVLPTAYLLARVTSEDLELSGYTVKAGTVVICHTGTACRNEKYFKNAKEFQPERWLGEERNETLRNSTFLVVPFGTGKRICPGKRLIEHILPIFLEEIINNFELKVMHPLELQFEFLLSSKGKVAMSFSDRI